MDIGVPAALQIPSGHAFTVESWVKLSSLAATQMIYSKNNARGSPYTYMFGFTSGGNYLSAHTGAGWASVAPSPKVTASVWHHLAFCFDGTYMRYYLDGALRGTTAYSFVNNAAHTVKLGGYANSTDLQGLRAETRVWDCARSADELRGAMSNRLSGAEAGLVGYWPVNEGSGSTVTDMSGSGCDGTNSGGAWESDAALAAIFNSPDGFVCSPAFKLASFTTGSRRFSNSNEVRVATFPVPAGSDAWQVTATDQPQAIDSNNWQPTTTPPTTLSFATPAADTNVILYAWFTNTSASVTLRRAAGGMVHTLTPPQAQVRTNITRDLVPDTPIAILPADIDNASSGAAALGLPMGIVSNHVRLLTGPDSDATPDLPQVTVSTAGVYEVEMVVWNEAGNCATSAICNVTVTTWSGGTVTWTGAESTDWHNERNWDRLIVPPAGAAVVLPAAASVTLTNATAELSSFTMDGGSLTFKNWHTRLSATNIVINGGTVTHLENSATAAPWTPDARVWLACSNLVIRSGAQIMLDDRGYGVNTGFWDGGRGPGGAPSGSNYGGRGGGGHGGHGGGLGDGGVANGLANAPENPGSSGGNSGGTPGKGGGVLRVDATGAVTNNGIISANGQATTMGGGAGGTVWITCRTIGGSGVVRANGGNCTAAGGGGGGGRIAVIYDTAAQAEIPLPALAYSANGGTSTGVEDEYGDIGTIYFSDTRFLSEAITWPGQLVVPDMAEWRPASLTVLNVWSRFAASGFTYVVGGDVVITGANGRLDIGAVTFNYYEGRTVPTNAAPQRLYAGGNLTLSGGGKLYVYAACTNGAFPDWGALISVTGAVTVGANSAIFPNAQDENGGSPLFEVGSLTVATNGAINADYRGYRTGQGGTYYQSGVGPGSGVATYGGGGGGGGYGGQGGMLGYGGSVYGSAADATWPGSGGAYFGGSGGGHGGGAIRIVSQGAVVVDGALSANGRNALGGVNGGGGAGGGINVVCSYIAGSGVIRANGGNGGTNNNGGGGGGGRIALHYDPAAQALQPLPDIKFSVRGGSYKAGAELVGDLGTLYFPDDRFLKGDMLHSGQWIIPGLSSWSPPHLTLSNTWIRFPEPGFTLAVQGDVVLDGASARLDIGGDKYDLWQGARASTTNPATLCVSRNLLLTNGATLYVNASATNGVPQDRLTRVVVAGLMNVASNSWVYPRCHNERGSFPVFEVASLNVSYGAGFNASGAGFKSRPGWYLDGLGPGRGRGTSNAEVQGGAGGYGGAGGQSFSTWGVAYGSADAPQFAASSGGNRGEIEGGSGGGVVFLIVTGKTCLAGSLLANGQAGRVGGTHSGGGGAGGTILLSTGKLLTTPTTALRANGGSASGSATGAGGGGGRIAVWLGVRPPDMAALLSDGVAAMRYPVRYGDEAFTFEGTSSVAGGSGITAAGAAGTVVFLRVAYPSPGTMLLLR